MMSPTQLEKLVAWVRDYDFDFQDYAEFQEDPAQSISTATVTASPSGLTLGTPTIDGSTVQLQISGGTAGTLYTVTCSLVTSAGKVVSMQGLLLVS